MLEGQKADRDKLLESFGMSGKSDCVVFYVLAFFGEWSGHRLIDLIKCFMASAEKSIKKFYR